MGIWVNSQLMADQFAANGYYCLIPDIFNGDALSLNRPVGFDLKKWINEGSDGKNIHTTAAIDPIVEAAIQYIRKEGITAIGAVGYCFGAKVGCHLFSLFFLTMESQGWKPPKRCKLPPS
jgi:dienelactone hydrolase